MYSYTQLHLNVVMIFNSFLFLYRYDVLMSRIFVSKVRLGHYIYYDFVIVSYNVSNFSFVLASSVA